MLLYRYSINNTAYCHSLHTRTGHVRVKTHMTRNHCLHRIDLSRTVILHLHALPVAIRRGHHGPKPSSSTAMTSVPTCALAPIGSVCTEVHAINDFVLVDEMKFVDCSLYSTAPDQHLFDVPRPCVDGDHHLAVTRVTSYRSGSAFM